MTQIRFTADAIGYSVLGFTCEDCGIHSIRPSFAIFLYIQFVRSDEVMLQGRWKSQAFMNYICPQVQAFSVGLSRAMMKNTDFFTILDRTVDVHEDHIMFNPEVTFLNDELFPVTHNDRFLPPTNAPILAQAV